ncbi:hypothetical protein SFC17_15775 [Bacillus paralicheniformis]|jgi:hypothetical protein|uniref:hypothetical protein n=1 Tax=Bacillus paralicheniformis TaxID=1648923 RepID=UPI001D94C59C|nr:hypothetical protein [Bacillus paralicheniformis]MBZ5215526.1 hypothetical protein [Bacillus paralicheniformis]WMW49899.1 hypothetical protein RFN66_21245 [Bacillus paralicheniformis]
MATSWNSIVPALNPTPAPITCGKKDIEYGNSLLADYLSEAIEKMFSLFFQEVVSSGRYDSSSNHKAMAKASCSDLRHFTSYISF